MSAAEEAASVTDLDRYGQQKRGGRVDENDGLVTVEWTATGITPMLQNAVSQDLLLSLWNKEKAAKTAERPTPREWANDHVYRLPDGRPCVPIKYLYGAMIGAGVFVRLDGKRQISNGKSTTLPGFLTITSPELPLIDPTTGESATWDVDIQAGKNPSGGEMVAVVRPRFDLWSINVEMVVDRAQIDIRKIRELVDIAGTRFGMGDFRPQKKGSFGRFKVDRWDVS